jgi:hypothetical protein
MRIVLGEWQTVGSVKLDREGRLAMPPPPHDGGLYRFRLQGRGAPSIYVGETDELVRRFGQYRNPGPTQRTNIRMNSRMREHLAAGGTVLAECCTEAWIHVGAEKEELDLSRKSHRMLAEETALAEAGTSAVDQIENIGGPRSEATPQSSRGDLPPGTGAGDRNAVDRPERRDQARRPPSHAGERDDFDRQGNRDRARRSPPLAGGRDASSLETSERPGAAVPSSSSRTSSAAARRMARGTSVSKRSLDKPAAIRFKRRGRGPRGAESDGNRGRGSGSS